MSRQVRFELSRVDAPPVHLEDDDRLQLDLRLKSDELAVLEAELVRRRARRQPNRKMLEQLACKIYGSRRARDRMLDKEGRGLFGEPAWDMLLALYCSPIHRETLTITGLSYAANVPLTTGHRWQKILTHEGLIDTRLHGHDLRLRLVRLTPRGTALMESYLTRLYHSEPLIPVVPEQPSD